MAQPKQGAPPVPDQGWVQWTESGKMYMSKKEKNVFVFEGVSQRGFSVVEFRGSEPEREILKSNNWALACELKVAPCIMCPKQDVGVVLDLVSANVLSSMCDFLIIRVNAANREIRVENYGSKSSGTTLFSSTNIASLRPGNYFNLRICGGYDVIHSISLNGVTIMQNLPFHRTNKPTNAIGIVCYGKTRALVRRFKVEEGYSPTVSAAIQSAQAAAHEGGTVGSTKQPTQTSSIVPYNMPGCASSCVPRSTCASSIYDRSQSDDLDLMALIERDIIVDDLKMSFDDIGGLDDAKQAINEAVVLPILMPEFFVGIRKPWRGVLLFGPPGAGKTMLAKAVASIAIDNHRTFFNCSVSTLVSKWRGESEKLLRALFSLAQQREGSILFFDEVDSLISFRGGPSEHEASRRFKSEFLIHMDGLLSEKNDKCPFVLCTSNNPWDLDEAFRRRLEKRVYVPLPDYDSRAQMITLLLKEIDVSDEIDVEEVASMTEGYSGADLRLLMREAAMIGLRRMITGISPAEVKERREAGDLNPSPVSKLDIDDALQTVHPSVSQMDIERFRNWAAEFGCT